MGAHEHTKEQIKATRRANAYAYTNKNRSYHQTKPSEIYTEHKTKYKEAYTHTLHDLWETSRSE